MNSCLIIRIYFYPKWMNRIAGQSGIDYKMLGSE